MTSSRFPPSGREPVFEEVNASATQVTLNRRSYAREAAKLQHLQTKAANYHRYRVKVEIEADGVKVLQAKARRARTTVSRLASDLLRQQLTMSA